LAVVVSLVVSGAMLYAQSAPEPPSEDLAAVAPSSEEAAPPPSTPITIPAEAELLAASAPAAARELPFALPEGVAPEEGLQVKTIWAARAISVMFPEFTSIGGYRQDPLRWHPNGLAIDVMIPNYNTPEGIELGNRIAGLVLANARLWGVTHVLWRQSFYPGVGAPSWMADLGNQTANHYDHLHIATNGGGYPTGQETYYLGAMRRTPPR
jgi:hypothetical protein